MLPLQPYFQHFIPNFGPNATHRAQSTYLYNTIMFKQKLKQAQPGTFKRFSRKHYALLLCFHREVKIGVLSVATLSATQAALAICPQAHTAGDTIAEQNLGEAIVTASRAKIAADKAARVVSVITRSDIDRAGATSVNDLLKLTVGADVRQRGGFGVQSDISINGGTFDQITILLNGVSVNNPQTGHLAADFPVSPDEIERIEILEGAAGRLMGSQAFSGAINIVTRRVDKNSLHANISAGSFGSVGAGANVGVKTADFTHFVSGNFTRSDGGTENSAFNLGNAFYNGTFRSDNVTATWQTGIVAKEYGANTFYSAAYPRQWESNTRIFASAKAETQGKIHVSPQISWIRSTDHFELIRRSPRGENFHRNDVFSFSVNAWTKWLLGRTAIGAELRSDNIISSNLGRPLDSTRYVAVSGHKGNFYTHDDHRTDINYFVEHNVVAGIFTFSAGLLVNRNTAVDEKFRLYPGVDVSCRPGNGLRLFASWNKAMRLPTFTDLYYKSPTQEGNVGLQPERVSAVKIGAEWRNNWAEVLLQGYYNHGSNMIDWVMYSADDIYHSANFKLDNYGFSVNTAVDFPKLLNEKFPVKRLTLAYAYIWQDKKDGAGVYRSNYAMEYLRHKFVATLDHNIWSRLSASWSLRWQKREGTYIKYSGGQNTEVLKEYPSYALLNLKLSWKAPHYEIYATADNLTARKYYDLGNVPQPRCWAMAGVKLDLDL